MENIWQWGIDVITAVQKIRSPFFDSFFLFISFFGTHIFYILLIPLIYWCYDKKYASRILILFLISGWLNTVMKDMINHPRPYNLDETVKIGNTKGPGIPSGHAQQSLVVLSALSLWRRNRFFTSGAAVLILLIALSRIYLGVHFPTDILGGWLLGAVIIAALWPVFDKIENFLQRANAYILASVAVIIPGLLALITASVWPVMSMGALSGFCEGLILEKRYIGFERAGNTASVINRFLTGTAVPGILFSAEKLLFSSDTSYYMIIVFIYSFVIGIWISAGAPWMFKKIRI